MRIEIKLTRVDIERACRAYVADEHPELTVDPSSQVAWDQNGTVVWVEAKRRAIALAEGQGEP